MEFWVFSFRNDTNTGGRIPSVTPTSLGGDVWPLDLYWTWDEEGSIQSFVCWLLLRCCCCHWLGAGMARHGGVCKAAGPGRYRRARGSGAANFSDLRCLLRPALRLPFWANRRNFFPTRSLDLGKGLLGTSGRDCPARLLDFITLALDCRFALVQRESYWLPDGKGPGRRGLGFRSFLVHSYTPNREACAGKGRECNSLDDSGTETLPGLTVRVLTRDAEMAVVVVVVVRHRWTCRIDGRPVDILP